MNAMLEAPQQNIEELELGHRLILETASLYYFAVSVEALTRSAKDYWRARGLHYRITRLQGIIDELVEQGLLIPKKGPYDVRRREHESRLQCRPDMVEDITAGCLLAGRFADCCSKLYDPKLVYYADLVTRQEQNYRRQRIAFFAGSGDSAMSAIVGRGFRNWESVAAIPESRRIGFLEQVLAVGLEELRPAPACEEWLQQPSVQVPVSPRLVALLGEHWILRGQAAKLNQLPLLDPLLTGWRHFLARDFEAARESIESVEYTTPWTGLLHLLSLIRQEEWRRAEQRARLLSSPWLAWLVESRMTSRTADLRRYPDGSNTPTHRFFEGLARHYEDLSATAELQEALLTDANEAARNGYAWVEAHLHELVLGQPRTSALFECLPPTERWRSVVADLVAASQPPSRPTDERLIWVLTDGVNEKFEARVQKRAQRGGWTSGRLLRSDEIPTCADERDRQMFKLKRQEDPGFLMPLVGHPLVFLAGDLNQAVDVSEQSLCLRIERTQERVRVSIDPPLARPNPVQILRDGARKLKLVQLNDVQRKMASLLGPSGVSLPESEQETLNDLVCHLSAVIPVHSDSGTVTVASVEEVEPDCSTILRMRPWMDGLEVQALVRPLGLGGPEFVPGSGGRTVLARMGSKTVQTVRCHERERGAILSLLEQCPCLTGTSRPQGRTLAIGPDEFAWRIPDVALSLTLLEELKGLPEVSIEWPEGQPMRVSQSLDFSNVRLSVTGSDHWFELSGGVTLDNGQVLAMSRLLELYKSGSRSGYLALGRGEFLALAETFRRRLDDLADLCEPTQAGSLRMHPLVGSWLEEFPQLEADTAFLARLERLRQAEELWPEPPSTLRAELRDYQKLGYQWLAQRAHWGVGACLADDMGLGKTLQALALIVARAGEGPTLVIAPTSVTGNWMAEAARFAPTLQVHVLAEGDRQRILATAGPFDLVIASYGILVNEIDLLSQPVWETVILDEAQAIKNSTTQRFKSAVRLQARARITLTGTPIENRLDELWAQLRFLNPGLLGSLERFRARFVSPIESGDASARDRLRRLIAPFLLRRTKTQVLQELPARTEITLQVPPTTEERAFYEALRRNALENLAGAEIKLLVVLAELTRLRRACCHPRLVLPSYPSEEGSKLQMLTRLLDEMRQGNHRALVFSQFVDHLSLVRAQLEALGVSYQYLDGSTPAQERTRRVAAFQAGQGEVFLISLKAGGLGLNLTGADYVIHLDPWWNPAVEDQASDRAHRFGQTRPVTIYRMVASHTVEEKIVAMHGQKRELAESLLAGTEAAARLSADELLRLIRES